MPRVMETTVYKFSELSDAAKEKAREWFRQGNLDYDWWEFVYDDVATIADLIGIDLRTRPVKLCGGGTRHEPCIFFSGFSSQGDGASWEGTYSYKEGSVEAVKDHAPRDNELLRIAEGLYEIQRRYFYKLSARVKHSGHYYHSGCMDIDVDFGNFNYNKDTDEELAQLLRDFADWIYKQLNNEYDYRMSDEAVDEDIEANEYEFDEGGHRA
jgi:hypothetical protein